MSAPLDFDRKWPVSRFQAPPGTDSSTRSSRPALIWGSLRPAYPKNENTLGTIRKAMPLTIRHSGTQCAAIQPCAECSRHRDSLESPIDSPAWNFGPCVGCSGHQQRRHSCLYRKEAPAAMLGARERAPTRCPGVERLELACSMSLKPWPCPIDRSKL